MFWQLRGTTHTHILSLLQTGRDVMGLVGPTDATGRFTTGNKSLPFSTVIMICVL